MRYYDPGFSDDGPVTANPFGGFKGTMVLRLVLITAGAYLIFFILYLVSAAAFDAVMGALALTPAKVFGRGFVWQLITFGFLHHPTAVLEILFNLIFFSWMGLALESVWGGRRFLYFCLMATLFTGLCYAAASYLLRPVAVVTGMSGLLMAALMVYTLWWPNRTVYFFFIIPMRIWHLTALIVLIAVLATLSSYRDDLLSGLVHLSYLGGLAFGWIVTRTGGWYVRLVAFRERAEHELHRRDESRLDEILDKVHRQGMNSLSWGERRFLKRYSRERR